MSLVLVTPDWASYFIACFFVSLRLIEVFGLELMMMALAYISELLSWLYDSPFERILVIHDIWKIVEPVIVKLLKRGWAI